MIEEPAIGRNNPLWELATEYLSHLQFERRLSTNTLNAYNHDLKKYTNFMFDKLQLTSIDSIQSSHIENFVNKLSNKPNMDKDFFQLFADSTNIYANYGLLKMTPHNY